MSLLVYPLCITCYITKRYQLILAVIAATDARCGEVAVVAVVVDVQDSAEEDKQEVEVLSVFCTIKLLSY